jgi:hypothetical protein
MNITRRTWLAGAAVGPLLRGARRSGVQLEALSGPRLPHRLTVPGFPEHASPYFELREYQASDPDGLDRLHGALMRGEFIPCGIEPLLWQRDQGLHYLFPFESLGARAQSWTLLASDPSWVRLRESVRVSGVAIYRRAS